MTQAMGRCAEEIRGCWLQSDSALKEGDTERANRAFGRVFELVDSFPAIEAADVRTLQLLGILTWVKVAAALEATGQDEEAREAQVQAFTMLDDMYGDEEQDAAAGTPAQDITEGLASEESVDLVGRLYLLCSKAGRKDSLRWGRCFMDLDLKVHGENPRSLN